MANDQVRSRKYTPTDTLEIVKIPANANKILSLFKHFKKYGRLRSIYSVGTSAFITYDTIEMATTAFESTEAYANNRFVRYFYCQKAAEKISSKLSKTVNMEHIRQVLAEVQTEIESAEKERVQLQSEMSRNTRKQDMAGLLAEFKRGQEELTIEAGELIKERERVDESKIAKIDERLMELQKSLEEAEISIRDLEKMTEEANDE
jgi:hypothetical protein